jgi:two-component system, chemotaxis family, protein-glutamate methylesterase/glutaminase
VINEERLKRDVIVIGASAGGVQPLKDLLGLLPPNLLATVAIVLHRSPYHETRLPAVLGRHALLSVLEPADRDPVLSGAVYVAPRDQHMVFDDGLVRLSRGAREHHTRPAIDPLFRSAAARYGPRVVGVLLSGLGSDGVSGLIAIKNTGGISLVQHPGEATFGSMPCTAIAEDDVDAMLTVNELASTLTALARGEAVEARRPTVLP